MLRIKLVKSPIGNTAHNRLIVQALGLRKMHRVVEHEDTASIRGMIRKIKHLLDVEVTDEVKVKAAPKPVKAKAAAPKAAKAAPAPKKAAAAAAEPKAPRARKTASASAADKKE
jgi:large subunit ribosomal protein L30